MRLIDADRPKRAIQQTIVEEKLEGRNTDGLQQVVYFLDSCPTVDAVPVVRCKDCRKGAVSMVHEQKVVRCPYLERCMDLEGFCCFGERTKGNVR